MKKDLMRETHSLNLAQVPGTQRHIVVSPTVTRRPRLDAMLGNLAVVAEWVLECLTQKAMNHQELTKEELRRYETISNTVIRQTRAEMEVEKHVEARTKGESDQSLAMGITRRLSDAGVDDQVILLCLEVLGLDE